ncbi:MAG: hypothetical protein ABI678_00975 [Kofleriaceae bacterium]
MTRDDESDLPGSFGHGLAVGFALCAVLVHIALVGLAGNWAKVYEDMGAKLPLMTRVTTSIAWQLGVPVVAALGLGALILRRPRSSIPYVAAAVVLTLAAACTYWFPTAPIGELAGNIRAD